jgi:ketosteroid isomerase-like protein
MTLRLLALSLFSLLLGAGLFAAAPSAEDRAADSAAIRAHIESIFQAFIDWDADKVYATHSEDWRGFLTNSRAPIKGIDEYMRANGFDWPKDKGAKPNPDPGRGYRMEDFDVIFHGPDLAVASFFGEFYKKADNSTLTRFRIMDVYARRQGGWIQVASHTVVDPVWRSERMSLPAAVTPQMRRQILSARESVWRAYFANDRPALERMLPEEVIALDDGSAEWSNRAAILAGAKEFADSGAKLVRLEFPRTEIQVYGQTAVLYTTYLYEIETKGRRTTKSGRGTEIFVRRGPDLVNVGWHLDSGG